MFRFFFVVDGVVDVASCVNVTIDNCGELVCWNFMNFDMLDLSLSWMCLRYLAFVVHSHVVRLKTNFEFSGCYLGTENCRVGHVN